MEVDRLKRIRQVQHFSVLAAFVFVPRSSFLRFGNFLSFACRGGITGYREHVLWWCYTGQFGTTIFSAAQRCNVVTISNNVAAMFPLCISLKIVVVNRSV